MIICQKCGRPNEDHYRFCLGCGVRLADQKQAAAKPAPKPQPSTTTQASPPVQPKTVGYPPLHQSEAKPKERVCQICSHPALSNDAFCGKCGARIADSVSPPAPVASRITAKLILIRADGSEGQSIELHEGDNIIGRNTPALSEDPFISPQHACFTLRGEELQILDMGSTNGVFIRLKAPVLLAHGTRIRVGLELLEFQIPSQQTPIHKSPDDTQPQGSPFPKETWGRLVRLVGSHAPSHAYSLSTPQVVIGRDVGDIIFNNDAFVSGKHTRLTFNTNQEVALEDLNSSNGTYIQVYQPSSLEHGDILLLGQQIVRIYLDL